MGKIKKLQDKGATILPLTVADAVLMNSAEAGNLSTYLEALKSGVDFLLSIIGEDQAGDIFLKTKDGMPRGFYTDGFVSAGGKSTTEGGGGTGGGLSVSQMWAELAKKATSTSQIIDDSHIPSTVARITDLPDMTKYVEKGDMGDFLTKDDLKWKNITD